jgi:hypothetical protein
MIELIQKQSKEDKRILELINNDDLISEDEVIELQDLLTRSRISRDGLIKLVCDMRQNLIKPLGVNGTYILLEAAHTALQTIRGTKNGEKGAAKRKENGHSTEPIKEIWRDNRTAIESKNYHSQYLLIPKIGGKVVFAEDMEKKFRHKVKASSIEKAIDRWKKESGG